eukprot:GDKJ01019925.1.p1 GENE.GDKJ01019925.1~~GDKJ01019925.1.p1  ORF type:complete len:451 (+),score=181.27 GDKJ01019925.1:78-1355(+)
MNNNLAIQNMINNPNGNNANIFNNPNNLPTQQQHQQQQNIMGNNMMNMGNNNMMNGNVNNFNNVNGNMMNNNNMMMNNNNLNSGNQFNQLYNQNNNGNFQGNFNNAPNNMNGNINNMNNNMMNNNNLNNFNNVNGNNRNSFLPNQPPTSGETNNFLLDTPDMTFQQIQQQQQAANNNMYNNNNYNQNHVQVGGYPNMNGAYPSAYPINNMNNMNNNNMNSNGGPIQSPIPSISPAATPELEVLFPNSGRASPPASPYYNAFVNDKDGKKFVPEVAPVAHPSFASYTPSSVTSSTTKVATFKFDMMTFDEEVEATLATMRKKEAEANKEKFKTAQVAVKSRSWFYHLIRWTFILFGVLVCYVIGGTFVNMHFRNKTGADAVPPLTLLPAAVEEGILHMLSEIVGVYATTTGNTNSYVPSKAGYSMV